MVGEGGNTWLVVDHGHALTSFSIPGLVVKLDALLALRLLTPRLQTSLDALRREPMQEVRGPIGWWGRVATARVEAHQSDGALHIDVGRPLGPLHMTMAPAEVGESRVIPRAWPPVVEPHQVRGWPEPMEIALPTTWHAALQLLAGIFPG